MGLLLVNGYLFANLGL